MRVRVARVLHGPDVWAVLFLIVWPLVYFWRITLAQDVLFTTDVLRLFYPFGLELARALERGGLPLWSPGLNAGFPLFAEGQVGAAYPPNLFLYKLLPAHLALSYSIVLHLAWAGCGVYAYVRSLGVRPWPALIAGIVFSSSGFILGHLSHPSVIAAVAWLPWLVLFLERFQKARSQGRSGAGWFLVATLGIATQLLAGSVQVAFLNGLVFCMIGICGGLFWYRIPLSGSGNAFGQILGFIALTTALPLVLGVGIAAIQLVPTAELVGYSVRGGTSFEFFSSYSLPPTFLTGLFDPFFRGEPSEATGEFWPYFGLAPLFLAISAPWLRRDRRTLVTFALGVAATLLALGGATPLYRILYVLPLFGLFRVPARYLLILTLAGAILAATAVDELAKRQILQRKSLAGACHGERSEAISARRRDCLASLAMSRTGAASGAWLVATILLPVGVVALVSTQSLEFWLQVWKALPVLLAAAFAVVMLIAWKTRGVRSPVEAALFGLVVLDLACFGAPFLSTIDALTPVSYVESIPRSIPALARGAEPERVLTDLAEFPSVPALRGSLFPNTAMIYGWESGQAYTSLSFARHELYMNNLSPAMVDLANIRYVLVPLEPRSATRSLLPDNTLALHALDNEIPIAPIRASAIELVSFTEQGANLADGTRVAEVSVRFDDGTSQAWPVRIGVETADWDYERKGVLKEIVHARAPIARSFASYWRSFGRPFEGHDYSARYRVDSAERPRAMVAMQVRSLLPQAHLTVERIVIYDEANRPHPLSELTGRIDFTLAFMSDTVAVWENPARLPRAFLAHEGQIVDDNTAFDRMQAYEFRPGQTVLLSEGDALAEPVGIRHTRDVAQVTRYEAQRVSVTTDTDKAGYLVLTDSWYPGWNVTVDGVPVPLRRADLIFRAVLVPAGRHTVEFEYRPTSIMGGAAISLASLLASGIVALVLHRKLNVRGADGDSSGSVQLSAG